jgi:predicted hotdog family 3-hydroxylacyl-ACP dehydratase
MRSSSWLAKFWKRLSTGIVQDVPARLEACEACREIECTQERWESCQRRLTTEAARIQGNGNLGGTTPASAPDRTAEVAPSKAQAELAAKPKPAPSS